MRVRQFSVFRLPSPTFMATSNQAPVTPERLMQFGFAYAPPLIIGAAVKNKVFDSLLIGPKTVEQVSSETGASVRGLRLADGFSFIVGDVLIAPR